MGAVLQRIAPATSQRRRPRPALWDGAMLWRMLVVGAANVMGSRSLTVGGSNTFGPLSVGRDGDPAAVALGHGENGVVGPHRSRVQASRRRRVPSAAPLRASPPNRRTTGGSDRPFRVRFHALVRRGVVQRRTGLATSQSARLGTSGILTDPVIASR